MNPAKVIFFLLVFFVSKLYCYENPIYHVSNRDAGINYTVKNFYVYNYTNSHLQGYARLYYSGTNFRQYVSMTVSMFKNGAFVGSKESYADFETYGSSGMLPGAETYFHYYIDKVDFDSVLFNVSYSSSDGSEPWFNKNALAVTNTAITLSSGSTEKIVGIIKNNSNSILKYPTVFMCIYMDDQMTLYKMTYADAPDNKLEPLQTATFYTYVDLPASYDSIEYIPNYSPSLTGPVIMTNVTSENYHGMPDNYSLSTNYPNPFNISTTIEFFLPAEVNTKLIVYDIQGHEVEILVDGIKRAGHHFIKWNASALSSGMYYYCLQAGTYRQVKSAILLK